MKVKIIRPTIAQHRQVMPGDELEVSKDEAVQLIGAGKAVAVKDGGVETTTLPAAEVEVSEALPEEAETADAPAEEDAKPRRGRPKKASE